MMKRPRGRRGFTLLEILLATGIFMVIMVVGIAIFTVTVGNASSSEQARVNAQSARFAFESIIREARLAKGLVYTDTTDAGEGVLKMLIPPFDFDSDSAPTRVNLYQVQKVGTDPDGNTTYSIDRRSYFLQNGKIVLESSSAYTGGSAKTSQEIYKIVVTDRVAALLEPSLTALDWSTPSTVDVLPNDRAANQFSIVRWTSYPRSDKPIDTINMMIQPYFEIQTTVYSPNYNLNRSENDRITTTLRTMIVPRNFVSPFEVVQPGIQGATN